MPHAMAQNISPRASTVPPPVTVTFLPHLDVVACKHVNVKELLQSAAD